MSENERKELTEALNELTASFGSSNSSNVQESGCLEMGSSFKVAGANLPAKPSVWTKMKNVLLYESLFIKVTLLYCFIYFFVSVLSIFEEITTIFLLIFLYCLN